MDHQTVASGIFLDHITDRIGKFSYLADALRHASDSRLCQLQSIQHDIGNSTLGSLHIQFICSQNRIGTVKQCLRHCQQCLVLLLGSQLGDLHLCGLRGLQHIIHKTSP